MRLGFGPRRITLALITLAGVVVFAPQAVAQPFETTTTTVEASPAAATTGQEVVLTATVTCPGFPPGGGLGVTFFAGSELLDTMPLNASEEAALTTTFDAPGSYTITASYNGNSDCGASYDEMIVDVTDAPTPPEPCGCGGDLINLHNVGINNGDNR
jgi:Bacterial Ig-like domain (group 3)